MYSTKKEVLFLGLKRRGAYHTSVFMTQLGSVSPASKRHDQTQRTEPKLIITCISLQVLRCYHDDEADGSFVAEHIVGPPADGTHALHCRDAVVSDQHLKRHESTERGHGGCI